MHPLQRWFERLISWLGNTWFPFASTYVVHGTIFQMKIFFPRFSFLFSIISLQPAYRHDANAYTEDAKDNSPHAERTAGRNSWKEEEKSEDGKDTLHVSFWWTHPGLTWYIVLYAHANTNTETRSLLTSESAMILFFAIDLRWCIFSVEVFSKLLYIFSVWLDWRDDSVRQWILC